MAYCSTLKLALGVQNTTPNDITCLDANVPKAELLIKDRQQKIFSNIVKREGFNNTHLSWITEVAKTVKSPCGIYIQSLNMDTNHSETLVQDNKTAIRESSTTRRAAKLKINSSV